MISNELISNTSISAFVNSFEVLSIIMLSISIFIAYRSIKVNRDTFYKQYIDSKEKEVETKLFEITKDAYIEEKELFEMFKNIEKLEKKEKSFWQKFDFFKFNSNPYNLYCFDMKTHKRYNKKRSLLYLIHLNFSVNEEKEKSDIKEDISEIKNLIYQIKNIEKDKKETKKYVKD